MENVQNLKSCNGFEDVVRMVGGKWKLLILKQLVYHGTQRFNELRRSVTGITQTMLTKQLRSLEQDDLVSRMIYAEVPPRVEYRATEKAKDLDKFFSEMYHWSIRHKPNDIAKESIPDPVKDVVN